MPDTEKKHKIILQDFYKKYGPLENEEKEFTWDGPSNWSLWKDSFPRILFLVKEARKGFHPCVPNQSTNSKFAKNIARWKCVIRHTITKGEPLAFPGKEHLPETNDDICIVEVKKLNEEKRSSSRQEILNYAKADKDLLKEQINLLDPQLVVCCGTFECYDVIFDHSYDVETKLITAGNSSCWLLNNRLVLDFCHPSTWPGWRDPNQNDIKAFDSLNKLMTSDEVRRVLQTVLSKNVVSY